ncbi:hypothetical protein L914_15886 [Phytophthora nicotianae]|uniref:Uncharacterized protein n=1 Tax=Phytophthora nicotianae TaxID=4792 RepID=W2MMJ6_PHYNI|nr:hypothetical protein L914_15886 [Phytophthora nicotianae]
MQIFRHRQRRQEQRLQCFRNELRHLLAKARKKPRMAPALKKDSFGAMQW